MMSSARLVHFPGVGTEGSDEWREYRASPMHWRRTVSEVQRDRGRVAEQSRTAQSGRGELQQRASLAEADPCVCV